MIKQAPSVGRILTMVAFALSCFGILIFLWLSFGGSVPLQPKGYRFNVPFPEATQLAQEAEVRISGVKVGSVRRSSRTSRRGLTDAVLEIDSRYAPLPQGHARDPAPEDAARRDLRGARRRARRRGRSSRTAGRCPRARWPTPSSWTRSCAPSTPRRARPSPSGSTSRAWPSATTARRSTTRSGSLTPFAENTDDVLEVLNDQSAETRALVRNTGEVFGALTQRQGQLRELIVNSNRVWETTARRDAELADTFRVLPTFLREGRTTTRRLTEFAKDTNPLIDQLRPAARQLSPALVDLDKLAPDLRGLFTDLGPLVRVSRRGLPATEQALDNTQPAARAGSTPSCASSRRSSTTSGSTRRRSPRFFANDTAVTQAAEGNANSITGESTTCARRTRTNPEIMAGYPNRISTNRSNPYTAPGGYTKLTTEGHLEVFGTQAAARRRCPPPRRRSTRGCPPASSRRSTTTPSAAPENRNAAPPCDPQSPLGPAVRPERAVPAPAAAAVALP